MAEIKNRFNGKVIFACKGDLSGEKFRGADLRDAKLRGANLGGADLGWADLRGADLREANLYWAKFGGAKLGGADLRDADLGWADLGGADLGWADLRGADLNGANLNGASLRWAVGNGSEIKTIIADNYHATWHGSVLAIGCHQQDIKDWLSMSDEEIKKIGPLNLWKKWRPVFEIIFAEHIKC